MSYGRCEYCGPICYRGAEHNARVEDGAKAEHAGEQVPDKILSLKAVEEILESFKALHARTAKLEDAVRWALGQNGDFRVRYEGEGAYWWRNELRERAGLDDPRVQP